MLSLIWISFLLIEYSVSLWITFSEESTEAVTGAFQKVLIFTIQALISIHNINMHRLGINKAQRCILKRYCIPHSDIICAFFSDSAYIFIYVYEICNV